HPTAEWTAQQLREAFPFDQAPKYLLRDRDGIFGGEFWKQVADLGMEEVRSAPRSPWQRAYVERVIGTMRRECPDQVIVFQRSFLVPAREVLPWRTITHPGRTFVDEGFAGTAIGGTTSVRSSRRNSASRRTSPPL